MPWKQSLLLHLPPCLQTPAWNNHHKEQPPPFPPKLETTVFITSICEFQNQQETCKEIPPLNSSSKYDFNEDIQDMFYSKKRVFKLQDWRHIFVYPCCKIWHSCVDTWEIWSSTSITPAHNASQKPFSISIALTWQWSTRITLKIIYWVICVYNMNYKNWGKIHRRYFAWVIPAIIFS